MLQLSDFEFELPEHAIAQVPMVPRDHSRLMVLSNEGRSHRHFYDLPELVRSGDVIVMNDTRVINARLMGTRLSGGRVEILLVERQPDDDWLALIRPSKRVAEGDEIAISPEVSVRIIQKNAVSSSDHSAPLHRVRLMTSLPWAEALERVGQVPLPPYIRNGVAQVDDLERYQTVVARTPGAVAAPTAGLHFTDELLDRLRSMGVIIWSITLHVGYGTFKPISVTNLDDHRMHEESYFISEDTAAAVTRAKKEGRRVIAVGTTVTRCLESAWGSDGIQSGAGSTALFLRPGSSVHVIDGLITNFHLPRSSLLVLVSALMGIEQIKSGYAEAISRGYRFYSYGDAMLLWVPQ